MNKPYIEFVEILASDLKSTKKAIDGLNALKKILVSESGPYPIDEETAKEMVSKINEVLEFSRQLKAAYDEALADEWNNQGE